MFLAFLEFDLLNFVLKKEMKKTKTKKQTKTKTFNTKKIKINLKKYNNSHEHVMVFPTEDKMKTLNQINFQSLQVHTLAATAGHSSA